ncbi:hypothetical protein [Kordia sp.]|uniref:hypothetical protein n=1 Tax=Kordia sp. TaxID=1965332 RepID=UPI003B5BC919
MKLLKTRPESEAEINLILEILQSNYQIDQVDRRNKEWQLLLIDDHPDAKCAIHKKQQLELIQ